jgi:hypothetical protein
LDDVIRVGALMAEKDFMRNGGDAAAGKRTLEEWALVNGLIFTGCERLDGGCWYIDSMYVDERLEIRVKVNVRGVLVRPRSGLVHYRLLKIAAADDSWIFLVS